MTERDKDWRIDWNSPPRIDAMDYTRKYERSIPPWPNHNLHNGFAFLGADLKSNPKETWVVLEDWSDRTYEASYPRMELYTLFPAFGRLYCFDKTVEKDGQAHISAFRLDDGEMPAGVKLGRETYIFPMRTARFRRGRSLEWQYSGSLSPCMIVVGPIGQEGVGKEARFTAKVITSPHPDELGKCDEEIAWQVVRVGDIVKFGKWDWHRVANIVPPNNEGYKVRGHVCKMLGWIELDRKPIPQKREE